MRAFNQRDKDFGTASGVVMNATPQAGARPGELGNLKGAAVNPKGDAALFWHLRERK